MRVLAIPFPPLEEQTEIVNRVEQLFAYADQIEQRVKDAQARVNCLTIQKQWISRFQCSRQRKSRG